MTEQARRQGRFVDGREIKRIDHLAHSGQTGARWRQPLRPLGDRGSRRTQIELSIGTEDKQIGGAPVYQLALEGLMGMSVRLTLEEIAALRYALGRPETWPLEAEVYWADEEGYRPAVGDWVRRRGFLPVWTVLAPGIGVMRGVEGVWVERLEKGMGARTTDFIPLKEVAPGREAPFVDSVDKVS